MSYAEDLARMRAERQGRDRAAQLESIRRDHEENLRLREEAQSVDDRDAWDWHDREAERLEFEYARIAPPLQPELDPSVVEFVQKNKAFFDRHGQRAVEGLHIAHQYATRPFIPGATNPTQTGMGLRVGTPEYFEALRSLLEMYGAEHGLPYSREDEVITPNEAAEISGVSTRTYNREVRKMYEGGYDAYSRQGLNSRKVG